MAASSEKNASTTAGKMSTKDLARSLGLIRKLSSSTKKCDVLKANKQPFKYLVVIDFESTCWKDKRMSNAPEIIEFPAVLMHTSTGVIESEFHQYVQPIEHPRLSEFCKELTGITQLQVDDGIPIGSCLMLFNNWLQELYNKKNIKFLSDAVKATETEQKSETDVKWCTFVTWSDWDIGICLKNECQRKRHLVPQPMRCWIDLRATYKAFYSRKPNGLAGALKDLGIQFTGRQHFGLDDARNTARLARRMIKDGCVMNVTSSIDSSVSVLHQIIQNGFKKNKAPKEPKRNILNMLQSLEAQKSCEASRENQVDESNCIQNTVRNSVHAGTERKLENLKTQTNPNACVLKTRFSKQDGKDKFAALRGNQMQNAATLSVQSLLAPPVSVSVSTSTVDAACDKTDATKVLVSPVTSLTSFTGLRCSSIEARPVSESAVRNDANLLKRKLPYDVNTPMAAKRGLVKQNLGMRLPAKSLGSIRDGSCFVKTSASPKLSAREYCPATIVSNQEKAKSKGTVPKGLCKSSNVSESKSKTPRLVDRTNLLSSHTLHSLERSTVKNVEKSSEVKKQKDTKIAEILDQENRIKVVDTGQGVFKTPKPVSSARRQTSLSFRNGYENLSTKATVTPKKFKSPNCVTPLSISGSVTPVLRFNGGNITPPLCVCGRRARRLTVGKPGPNQGRVFYACSVRNKRSSFGKSQVNVKKAKKNCKFFCWEPKAMEMSPFQRTLQGTLKSL